MIPAAPSAPADLDHAILAEAMPGRPVRSYPALLSTDADARAWARTGIRAGAVVVADYQASPRGRAGLPWTVRPGHGLGFSLVLRPPLAPAREGWLYVPLGCALLDALQSDAMQRGGVRLEEDPAPASVAWPDEVHGQQRPLARFGIHAELGAHRVDWAVATVLIEDAAPPRAPLLVRAVIAIERRMREEPAKVLARYQRRCATLEETVRARMIPLGPAGPVVTGRAVGVLGDGALVIRTDRDRLVPVHPQNLGLLEII